MLEPAVAAPKPYAPASGRMHISSATVRIVGVVVALSMCVGYVGWLVTLHSYPLQDFPNHLARGVILSDLLFDHGARFGAAFSFSWNAVPYLLHDLLLASLIKLFGAQGGGVFLALVLLSLPLALMFYMWAARLAPRAQPVVFLIALYLSTDCFFLLAFMGFRLALAFVIVSLGCVEWLRRRWHNGVFLAYVAVLICGYLTHLSATAFFAAALGVSTVVRLFYRRTTLRLETCLWIPLATVMLLHVLVLSPAHSASNPQTYEFFWGTWHKKIQYLTFEYTRFGSHLEQPMMLILAACLIWPLRRYLRFERLLQPAVMESLATAAAFLGAYFLMPQFYSDSAYVDVRALPVVVLMLLLACLNVPGPGRSGRTFATATTLALALALCVVNFAFLVRHVGKYEDQMNQYRALADTIPTGEPVLPVHTLGKDGELRPFLHASGYAVVDRGARVPYLFGGDRGDPMKYFRYRQRPYRPEEDWYRARLTWDRAVQQTYVVGGQTYTWRFEHARGDSHWKPAELVPVDWNRVACTYGYLLVTQPVDLKLLEMPLRRIGENPAAVLFAVDRSACASRAALQLSRGPMLSRGSDRVQ